MPSDLTERLVSFGMSGPRGRLVSYGTSDPTRRLMSYRTNDAVCGNLYYVFQVYPYGVIGLRLFSSGSCRWRLTSLTRSISRWVSRFSGFWRCLGLLGVRSFCIQIWPLRILSWGSRPFLWGFKIVTPPQLICHYLVFIFYIDILLVFHGRSFRTSEASCSRSWCELRWGCVGWWEMTLGRVFG